MLKCPNLHFQRITTYDMVQTSLNLQKRSIYQNDINHAEMLQQSATNNAEMLRQNEMNHTDMIKIYTATVKGLTDVFRDTFGRPSSDASN